jgi:hypothetical protein
VVEPVKGVFDAGIGFEGAGFNVADPAVSWPDIGQDKFIVDGLLIDQKLRELGTANNGVHKIF